MNSEPTSTDQKAADGLKWPGLNVYHLILETEDFIVCLDPELDVDWQTSAKYDQSGHKDPKRYNEVLNRAAALECIPNDHHRRSIRLNFKRMVGEGVARALEHHHDCADEIHDTAKAYITHRNVELARFWQLSTACVIGTAAATGAVVAWAVRTDLTKWLGETGFYLIFASLIGALGAVLSMIFRMGKSHPSSEAPRKLHILEAISRVVAGCVSGLLIAAAVKVGLILPVVGNGGSLHLAMLLLSLAAGASERWAPSLIASIEHNEDKKDEDKGGSR
jgi:hypothetical protein